MRGIPIVAMKPKPLNWPLDIMKMLTLDEGLDGQFSYVEEDCEDLVHTV